MIHTETRKDVCLVRMEHGKVNALDVELLNDLHRTFETLENSAPRAIVLTGTEKAFCAGVDLNRIVEGGASYVETFLPILTKTIMKVFTFPKPVVAALSGHAIAGGCVLAAACDDRIMARGNARVGLTELPVGVPYPTEAIELMRTLIPPSALQEILYFGTLYTPEQAVSKGLVRELVDPQELVETAVAVAMTLAAHPGQGFRLAKETYIAPTLDRIRRFAPEQEKHIRGLWQMPSTQKSIRTFMEKTASKPTGNKPA